MAAMNGRKKRTAMATIRINQRKMHRITEKWDSAKSACLSLGVSEHIVILAGRGV